MSKKSAVLVLLIFSQVVAIIWSWINTKGVVNEFLAYFSFCEVLVIGLVLQVVAWNTFLKRQTKIQRAVTGILFFGNIILALVWSGLIYQNAVSALLNHYGKATTAQVVSYQMKSVMYGPNVNGVTSSVTSEEEDPSQASYLIAKISYDGHQSYIKVVAAGKDFDSVYQVAFRHQQLPVKYLPAAPSIVKPLDSLKSQFKI